MSLIERKSNYKLFFLTIVYLSASPLVFTFKIKTSFLILLFFLYSLYRNNIIYSSKFRVFYILISLFLFTNIITSLYNETFVPFYYSIFFSIVCFIALQVSFNVLNLLVDKLTSIFLFLLYGSWIAFVYFQFGGPSLFHLSNPDGRDSLFFLTTFSNTVDPFRPAGIYDEPGAFSFFICLLVILRSLTKKSFKISALLLILGLITQSIAHFSFIIIWFLGLLFFDDSFSNVKSYKKVLTLVFTSFILVFFYLSGLFDWALNRGLYYSENPDATGRIPALLNIYYEISGSVSKLLFGFSEGCVNRTNCYFGENVLTPLVYGGLLASWPYYLFLFILIVIPLFNRKYYYLFGLMLLLIQRPYFLELPYSLSICLILTFYISKPTKDLIYYE